MGKIKSSDSDRGCTSQASLFKLGMSLYKATLGMPRVDALHTFHYN
jgi:hypothetical protein